MIENGRDAIRSNKISFLLWVISHVAIDRWNLAAYTMYPPLLNRVLPPLNSRLDSSLSYCGFRIN